MTELGFFAGEGEDKLIYSLGCNSLFCIVRAEFSDSILMNLEIMRLDMAIFCQTIGLPTTFAQRKLYVQVSPVVKGAGESTVACVYFVPDYHKTLRNTFVTIYCQTMEQWLTSNGYVLAREHFLSTRT